MAGRRAPTLQVLSWTAQPDSAAHGLGCPQVHTPLRRTHVNVTVGLKRLSIPLRPTAAQLTTQDTPRDTLPNGRIMHRLLLTYKLSLKEGGDITFVLQPLRKAVYDGALEGQLFAVFDSNKKRLAFGDVYPNSVTLAKGAGPPLRAHP